ncbi:MAG: GDP-mannose 4,6-dehydratase [Candidatus Nealsonbacteria bacterium]|nr:GDP-mannose 4,6-dehydratase [Candidatus Nealsonbacteria bacterium]
MENPSYKKILVTGNRGFFGTNFEQYIEREHPEIDLYGFDLKHGQDCRNYEQIEKAIKGKSLVFHFAAFTHTDTSMRYPELFMGANISGTLNVLKACTNHKVKLVYISSSEVYGTLKPGLEKQSEDHSFSPASPYATSKAACDLMCQNWYNMYGAEIVVVRPFNGYGFYQDRRKVMSKYIEYIEKGLPLQVYGSGAQKRDWTFAEEIVKGIWAARNLPAGEIINLCSGKNYSILDVINILKRITGRELNVEFIEPRYAEVGNMIGDASKAKRLLDWEAKIDLEEGLGKTYRWLKENKPIAYLGGEPKTLRFISNEGA